MSDNSKKQVPGKGIFNIGLRIITIIVNMAEARLQLAVLELEEEKANLIQILMMISLTMLFTSLGLISLLILIIWKINVQYRLIVITVITVVLFLLAMIFGIWTLRKSRCSTLLRHTRAELNKDCALLKEHAHESK